MSKVLLRIFAQCMENYAQSGQAHWKPKGGQEFQLRLELDDFSYAKEKCLAVIDKLIEEQSNENLRFVVVHTEVIIHDPITLDEERFQTMLDESLKDTTAESSS